MHIIDKEQERREAQKNPETKQKEKIRKLLYGVGIAIFLVAAFFYYRSPSYTGTPHTMQIAGQTIEPGETTVQQLAENGFEIENGKFLNKKQVYDIAASTMMGKSYSDLFMLTKDSKSYATIVIVNEDSGEKPLSQCKVREISVSEYYMDYENLIVDGMKLSELTVPLLTESNGKPYDNYTSALPEGGTVETTVWEDKHYGIEIEVGGEGTVRRVVLSYE